MLLATCWTMLAVLTFMGTFSSCFTRLQILFIPHVEVYPPFLLSLWHRIELSSRLDRIEHFVIIKMLFFIIKHYILSLLLPAACPTGGAVAEWIGQRIIGTFIRYVKIPRSSVWIRFGSLLTTHLQLVSICATRYSRWSIIVALMRCPCVVE